MPLDVCTPNRDGFLGTYLTPNIFYLGRDVRLVMIGPIDYFSKAVSARDLGESCARWLDGSWKQKAICQVPVRVRIALGSIEFDWLVPAFLPPTLEKSKKFLCPFWNQAVTRDEKMN